MHEVSEPADHDFEPHQLGELSDGDDGADIINDTLEGPDDTPDFDESDVESYVAESDRAIVEAERQLLTTALEYAGYNKPARLYVMQRASDDAPVVDQVYHEAQRWSPQHHAADRIAVFAERSTRPGGDEAWQQAVDAATHQGPTARFGALTHALVSIVPGQTDPERLQQVSTIGSSSLTGRPREQVLGVVAAQQAGNNDIDAAYQTLHRMDSSHEESREADEARVAIAAYWARQDEGEPSEDTLDALSFLSPRSRPWGEVAIAAELDGAENTQRWYEADAGLAENWHLFEPRERIAIVTTMRDAGQLDRAARYASQITSPQQITGEIPQAEADAVVGIAYAQAKINPEDGMRTLGQLIRTTNKQTTELYDSNDVNRGRRTYVGGALPALSWIPEIIEEKNGLHDQLIGHQLALYVRLNPQDAVARLERPHFRGKDQTYARDRAYGTVAAALAAIGETETALALVESIEHYKSSDLKSRAYADIAHTLRATITGSRPQTG